MDVSAHDARAEKTDPFLAVPLHGLLELEFVSALDLEPGEVAVEMPTGPGGVSATGGLHGGAISTLFDVACATAAAAGSAWDPVVNMLVTVDLHVRFLARARGTRVRATARVVRAGGALIVVDGRLVDDLGNLVATADFSAMLIPRRDAAATSTGSGSDLPDA